jgi:hypothetical protein
LIKKDFINFFGKKFYHLLYDLLCYLLLFLIRNEFLPKFSVKMKLIDILLLNSKFIQTFENHLKIDRNQKKKNEILITLNNI